MRNWTKITSALGLLLVVTSHLAIAQPTPGRGAGNAGAEARQSAEERVQEAGAEAGRPETTRPEAGAPAEQRPADAGAEAAQRGNQAASQARDARGAAGGQGQGTAQREAAMQRQAAQFDETHARRMAQLQRLRDLAVENERPDMVSRVDGLMTRELERHGRQRDRLAQRAESTGQPDRAPEEEPEIE